MRDPVMTPQSPSHWQAVLAGIYRLNPVLRLVAHTELTASERLAFERLAENSDHFGLLVSQEIPELGVQAVDRKGALLFSQLKTPSRAHDLIHDPLTLMGLVLDGILEFRHQGEFITGPSAYPILLGLPVPTQSSADAIAQLSFSALRWAQQLSTTDVKEISAWLYHYNRMPLSPTWARLLASPEQIDEYLGLEINGSLRRLLDDHFVSFEVSGWRAWRRLGTPEFKDKDTPTYKLYISPHPSVLSAVFSNAVNLFVEKEVAAFKLSSNAYGLLRPDKLIAYFQDYSSLEAVTVSLGDRLSQYPAQGVPFTASLSANSILSWGVDPPCEETIPGWQDILSWRRWITDRLARAMLRARILGSGEVEPWQFALARLSLDGVNTEHWLPSNVVWTGLSHVR
jgi:hypothetical protein